MQCDSDWVPPYQLTRRQRIIGNIVAISGFITIILALTIGFIVSIPYMI